MRLLLLPTHYPQPPPALTHLLTHRAGKPQYWRLILLVGAAVGALQGALLLGIPESPKYLVSVGNRRGARESLARLRGASYMEDEIRGN